MTDFITAKDWHTLEDLAIEVGLKKLGCNVDKCWGSFKSRYVSEAGGSYCTCNRKSEVLFSIKEIIAAALPFEADCSNFECYACPRIFSDEIELDNYCMDVGTRWQLTDPCLVVKTSSPKEKEALVVICDCEFKGNCKGCQEAAKNLEKLCDNNTPETKDSNSPKTQVTETKDEACARLCVVISKGHVSECPYSKGLKSK